MNAPKPTSLLTHPVLAVLLLMSAGLCSRAAIIFTDTFDSGASPLWGNESGAWSASGGVYQPAAPNNFPNAFSSLPFNLTNFSLDLDINGVTDGGIWLRSAPASGTAVGVSGVLLVLKYADFGGVKVYWHIVPDGISYGDALNLQTGSFPAGSNPHVHIEVSGDNYAAFINGATNPITTLNTSAFAAGRVALYDFSAETFDNIILQTPARTGAPVPFSTIPIVEVRWQAAFGSWYQVQASSSKADAKWTNLGDPMPGTGAEMSVQVEVSKDSKFIRVLLLQ